LNLGYLLYNLTPSPVLIYLRVSLVYRRFALVVI